jgi:hypothetical protein
MDRILKINQRFKKIVDTRNRIIHGYDSVSADIIWLIVNKHLPVLEKQVKESFLISHKTFTISKRLLYYVLSAYTGIICSHVKKMPFQPFGILSSASGNPIQIIIRINGFETGIGIALVPG